MSNYKLSNFKVIFKHQEDAPVHSISFSANDPGSALLLAQRYPCPAELWEEDKHICTLRRSGGDRGFWVISGSKALAKDAA